MRAHRMEDIVAAIFGKYCLPQDMKMYKSLPIGIKEMFRSSLTVHQLASDTQKWQNLIALKLISINMLLFSHI